jgi:hypothetical protein
LAGCCLALFLALASAPAQQKEPPALNPFGPPDSGRDDMVPGYVELSDGTVRPGKVYLTRDHRLKVFDAKVNRHREVPLEVIRRIDCKVVKEWLEKEWRFRENANDVKVYTGKSYPAREYVHTVTLQGGRKIQGPLAAIVYVRAVGADEPERFLLHKRDRGATGTGLKELLYVRTIRLGAQAFEEGKRLAARRK